MVKLRRREKKSKEIKRRVKKKLLQCWACREYYVSETMSNGKRCAITGDDITSVSDACDLFQVTHYFYCKRRHCYLDTLCCVTTRKKKKNKEGNDWLNHEQYAKVFGECKQNCPQGIKVEWFVEKYGIPPRRGPVVEKLKLRRRTKKQIREDRLKLKRRKHERLQKE